MKIIHLNYSDINGGAARAAYRIHHSVLESDIDSRLWVNNATTNDWTVETQVNKQEKATALVQKIAGQLCRRTLKTDNPVIHSPAVLPSRWTKRINDSNADIVHLHWVGNEMLSITDIARINKPIVWTLHDMWAFCGAEHYTEDLRWQMGYHRNNRPVYESGLDLNRWTWKRKLKLWKRPMHIVTPSKWLSSCVEASLLTHSWPLTVIPYPIDVSIWQPIEQPLARELLNLPKNIPLVLFGAMDGTQDPRKGFDLLQEAIQHLQGHIKNMEIVVFGQLKPKNPPHLEFPIHYTGHLHDDLSLRILYSAADVFVLPSRQDNLPLTAMESQSCGTPVVAFDATGPSSMIEHRCNGYLSKAFDPIDLATGIKWVIEHECPLRLRASVRKYAVNNYRAEIIAEQYKSVYNSILNRY